MYLQKESDLAGEEAEEPSLVESREHTDGSTQDAHQKVGGTQVEQQDVAHDTLVPDGGRDERICQETHGQHQSVEDNESLYRWGTEAERWGVVGGGVGGVGGRLGGEVERRRHAMLTSRGRASSATHIYINTGLVLNVTLKSILTF